MSRALTPAELVLLRNHSLRSRLYLVVHKPPVIQATTVLTAPTSSDRATQFVANDNANADIMNGMTIRISSGGMVKGYARLRSHVDGTPTIGVGEISDIDWANGDTVEILDDFCLWQKPIRIESTATVYVDEVAYTNQHATCAPIPIMGPPLVVRHIAGTVTTYWDASDSWEVNGGAVTYAWSVYPNVGVTISNAAIANPTITFADTGVDQHRAFRVDLTVSNGAATTIGHRYVFVLPETGYASSDDSYIVVSQMVLDSCQGNFDEGGWQFSLTAFDDVDIDDVQDRALCVLCADDWYGTTETSIGTYTGNFVTGRNNVVCLGWIGGESIDWNPELGRVAFEVYGPQWWLDRETNFPIGIFDTDFAGLPGGISGWSTFADLTVDKALWHCARWRSTLAEVTDVYRTQDTREIPVADAPIGSIWRQITAIAEDTILAHPAADHIGRVFTAINQQYIAAASRGAFPVVYQILQQDWRDNVTIERRIVEEASQVDSSGVAYAGGVANAYFSLAHGHIPTHYGNNERIERLALTSQAASNELAALIIGQRNSPIRNVIIPLATNQRVVDISPRQYVTMTMAATDTPRGLEWPDAIDDHYGRTVKYLIPRTVSHQWNSENGVLLTDIECEPESFPGLSTDGDPPPVPPDPAPPTPIPPPPVPWSEIDCPTIVYALSRTQLARSINFDEAAPNWVDVKDAGMNGKCLLRVSCENDGIDYRVFVFESTDDGTGNEFGRVWRCDNGIAGAVTWTEVLNTTDIIALLNTLTAPHVPAFTFGVPWEATFCTGILGRDNILYVAVQARVATYAGGAFNHITSFLLTSSDFGNTWNISYYTFGGNLRNFNAATSVHLFDEFNGYRTGGGQDGLWPKGACTYAGAENIVAPEFGPGLDSGNPYKCLYLPISGSYFGHCTNGTHLWSSSDGGILQWVDEGVADIDASTNFAVTGDDDYFYMRLDVAGEKTRIYQNGVLLLTSTDIYGNAGIHVSHVAPLITNADKFTITRAEDGANQWLFYWYNDGVLTDKTGDFCPAHPTWTGEGSGYYGNAMLAYFEDGPEVV